jgi:hypothetical protein
MGTVFYFLTTTTTVQAVVASSFYFFEVLFDYLNKVIDMNMAFAFAL